jgi:hypothetical protein
MALLKRKGFFIWPSLSCLLGNLSSLSWFRLYILGQIKPLKTLISLTSYLWNPFYYYRTVDIQIIQADSAPQLFQNCVSFIISHKCYMWSQSGLRSDDEASSHYATFSSILLLPLSFSTKLCCGLQSIIHRTRQGRPTLCLVSHRPARLGNTSPAVSSFSRQSPFILTVE